MPYSDMLQTAIFLAQKTKDPLLKSSIPVLSALVTRQFDDPEPELSFLEQNVVNCLHACERAYFVLYGKHARDHARDDQTDPDC